MNEQQIKSMLRAFLLLFGGYLTKKGITDDGTWEVVVGFIVGLVPLIWSLKRHAQPPGSLPTPPAASRLTGPLMLLLCFGLWTVDCGLLTGCKSTPQQIAYRSAGTTIVTVDSAMNFWGAYVDANHPGTNAELTVKNAFEKYQAAMAVLCDAGAAYAATGGTDATAMNALTQAAFNATTYLQDLENLIASFGVNLNAPTP